MTKLKPWPIYWLHQNHSAVTNLTQAMCPVGFLRAPQSTTSTN